MIGSSEGVRPALFEMLVTVALIGSSSGRRAALRQAGRFQSVGGNTRMADDRLHQYRQSIDNIDAALVFMLAERFKVTQAVGTYKAEHGLPPADPDRETRQVARLRRLAAEADLDPDFTEKFLRFIIDEVIRHHEAAQG
jgi:chorismate mutase